MSNCQTTALVPLALPGLDDTKIDKCYALCEQCSKQTCGNHEITPKATLTV